MAPQHKDSKSGQGAGSGKTKGKKGSSKNVGNNNAPVNKHPGAFKNEPASALAAAAAAENLNIDPRINPAPVPTAKVPVS